MDIQIAYSGSGALAPVHAGATCAFLDLGYRIVGTAGTSGGSILAGVVALGFSSEQIKHIALAELPDGIASFEITALFKHGLNDGQILLDYYQSIFGDKSFSDCLIPITIMATNIDHKCAYEFSMQKTPAIPLAKACRASSSVPFFYEPYAINNVMLQDGAMVNNIPVNKLDDKGARRFGIDIVDDSNSDINSLTGLVKQSISTLLNANEDNLIAWGRQTGAEILQIDANPYSFMDFEMTLEQKTDLFQRGYQAVQSYLQG